MKLTKDKILLLKHGLDMMCKAEGGSIGQVGLAGLTKDNVRVVSSRLSLAVTLAGELDKEYTSLVEAEEKLAAAAAAEGGQEA